MQKVTIGNHHIRTSYRVVLFMHDLSVHFLAFNLPNSECRYCF